MATEEKSRGWRKSEESGAIYTKYIYMPGWVAGYIRSSFNAAQRRYIRSTYICRGGGCNTHSLYFRVWGDYTNRVYIPGRGRVRGDIYEVRLTQRRGDIYVIRIYAGKGVVRRSTSIGGRADYGGGVCRGGWDIYAIHIYTEWADVTRIRFTSGRGADSLETAASIPRCSAGGGSLLRHPPLIRFRSVPGRWRTGVWTPKATLACKPDADIAAWPKQGGNG
jgi:hypothetical protein